MQSVETANRTGALVEEPVLRGDDAVQDADAAGRRGGGPGSTADPEAGFGLVEALVAAVILAVGLLAVGGIALGVASQSRNATLRTDQAMIGQQILEHVIGEPFGTYPAGTNMDTAVTIRGRDYTATLIVEDGPVRVDNVSVVVPGKMGLPPDTFRALIAAPPP